MVAHREAHEFGDDGTLVLVAERCVEGIPNLIGNAEIPSAAELKTFFAAATSARKSGFARAPSSAVKGVTDLSAPIIRGDRAAAALTVPYIKMTDPQDSVHTVIEKVQAVANSITAQLSEGDSRA